MPLRRAGHSRSLQVKVAQRIGADMQAMIAKLLTLLALVLMPFGMSPAAAEAIPAAAQHHAAPMAAHCPTPDAGDSGKASKQAADCTVACAAIVAPAPTAAPPPVLTPPPPARPLAGTRRGLHPEAATPPPKRA